MAIIEGLKNNIFFKQILGKKIIKPIHLMIQQ
jgi:hypothetical protein